MVLLWQHDLPVIVRKTIEVVAGLALFVPPQHSKFIPMMMRSRVREETRNGATTRFADANKTTAQSKL